MTEEHPPSSGIQAVIDQLNNAKLNLSDILDNDHNSWNLAAWEEYSNKLASIIWDEMQERIAKQRAKLYTSPSPVY